MSFIDNLDKILLRHQDLSDKLSSNISGEEFIKASKDWCHPSDVHQILDSPFFHLTPKAGAA